MLIKLKNIVDENPSDLHPDYGLVDSIKKNGLLMPLVVQTTEDGYKLCHGSRRLQALNELYGEDFEATCLEVKDLQPNLVNVTCENSTVDLPEEQIAADAYTSVRKRTGELMKALRAADLPYCVVSMDLRVHAQHDDKMKWSTATVSFLFPVDWKKDKQAYHERFIAAVEALGYDPANFRKNFPGSYVYEISVK